MEKLKGISVGPLLMGELLSCLNSVKIGLKKKKTVKNFFKILTKQSVNILDDYVFKKSVAFIPSIKIMFCGGSID